jgi:AcrR family transcriptional regulator
MAPIKVLAPSAGRDRVTRPEAFGVAWVMSPSDELDLDIVIDGAARAVAKVAPDAFDMDVIAAEAGVSRSVLDAHFASHSAVLRALVLRFFGSLADS